MIDFNTPLAQDPDPARTARETRDLLVAEGRAAYRAGMGPVPPPFRDPEMRRDWGDGYIQEMQARPRR